MASNGYIKLHRKLLDWGWYKDPNTKAVFLHLLLTANFTESEYMGVKIYPGQTVIGRKALAETLGMSERNVRTALEHLKETKEITITSTNKFSIVTVVGWELYQLGDEVTSRFRKNTRKIQNFDQQNDQQNNPFYVDTPSNYANGHYGSDQQCDHQVTNNRPASDHTIRKKESKNRESTHAPSFEEVKEYVQQLGYQMDPAAFYDYYESTGWVKRNGQPIKDWKASVRTWERREKQFKNNGNGSRPVIEPPKYKQFGPEPKIDAVEMPDNIRAAVNKILK